MLFKLGERLAPTAVAVKFLPWGSGEISGSTLRAIAMNGYFEGCLAGYLYVYKG